MHFVGPEEVGRLVFPRTPFLQDRLGSDCKTVLVSAVLAKVSRMRDSFHLTLKDED